MRVLLINSNRFMQPYPVIPYGLCIVASVVEKMGYAMQFLDLGFSSNPAEEIEKTISSFLPDVVGVSVRNIDNASGYNAQFLLEETKHDVIQICKKHFSGTIVIGGPAVGISGPEILEFFDLEYAIHGDGEVGMPQFLAYLKNEQTIEEVPGLIRRQNNEIVLNNESERNQNLDDLPMLRLDKYVDVKKYVQFGSAIPIQTKRGCPFNCVYCTYNTAEGSTPRLRKPEKVAAEIENIVQATGIKEVEFTDSCFNAPLEHSKEVLRAIKTKKIDVNLRVLTGMTPAGFDEEFVDLLRDTGFIDVSLGAESGSSRMLKNLRKPHTKQQLFSTAKILKKRKISITWFLLLGGPGETPETLAESFETVNALSTSIWDFVIVGVGLRVYKGAPVAEIYEQKYGTPKDSFLSPTPYVPEALTLEEVKMIAKREALIQSRYLIYEEEEDMPVAVLKGGRFMLDLFKSKQSVLKIYIFKRMAEKAIGLNSIKKLMFERKYKKHFGKTEMEVTIDKPYLSS